MGYILQNKHGEGSPEKPFKMTPKRNHYTDEIEPAYRTGSMTKTSHTGMTIYHARFHSLS